MENLLLFLWFVVKMTFFDFVFTFIFCPFIMAPIGLIFLSLLDSKKESARWIYYAIGSGGCVFLIYYFCAWSSFCVLQTAQAIHNSADSFWKYGYHLVGFFVSWSPPAYFAKKSQIDNPPWGGLVMLMLFILSYPFFVMFPGVLRFLYGWLLRWAA